MSDLNAQIKAAIDSSDIGRARELLREAMKEANAETFYLASQVALDDEQKHEFLEEAVSLDRFHEASRRALREITQPKSATAPAPSEAKQLLGKDLVAGTVKSDSSEINLHAIPVETGLVVTTLRSESTVYLIARDDDSKWFQVLYQSPIGIKYGWVNAAHIHDIQFNGNAINILDLPITNFELNSRDDVKLLIAEMRKSPPKGLRTINGAIVGVPGTEQSENINRKANIHCGSVVIIVFLAMAGIIVMIFDYRSYLLGEVILLTFILAIVLVIYLMYMYSKLRREALEADASIRESVTGWDKKFQRFHSLQMAMRSEYEVMRDDQRRDAAIGFAAKLGANLVDKAATRYFSKR
jgi:hypothetical protein